MYKSTHPTHHFNPIPFVPPPVLRWRGRHVPHLIVYFGGDPQTERVSQTFHGRSYLERHRGFGVFIWRVTVVCVYGTFEPYILSTRVPISPHVARRQWQEILGRSTIGRVARETTTTTTRYDRKLTRCGTTSISFFSEVSSTCHKVWFDSRRGYIRQPV